MKCINKNLPKVKELLEVVNDDEVALSSILEKYDTLPSVEEVSAKYSELSVRPVAFNKSLNTDLLNEVGRLVEVNDYGMIMTNGKDLKDDQLYAINQILIRKNSLYRQTYRLSQAKTGNYFITNGREGKISYNTTQSQRILPESAVQIMEVFKKRLGVDYQIINDDQAQNILKDKYNPAEGFYLHGGKVYVIEDNGTIDFDTTIHEFGHPFMRALRAYNPALFTNITNEISESKEGIDFEMIIKNDYKEWFEGENVKPEHVEDYLEELAVRGLTLYAKENFNPETGKPFQKAMDKLIRFLTTMLKDLFGRKELKLAALSPNTNLKELADIFSLKQGDINLEELSVLRNKSTFDVILPIGTSGSGKSTFIKTLPQENLVVIEPDAMRVEFTGDMNDKSKDKEIYAEAAKRAVAAIKQGKQVVFDTTNLTKDKRLPFIETIKKEIPNANIQYKLLELNPELAKQRIKAQLERGENRANVPDSSIDRQAQSYSQMLEDIKSEPISEYKNLETIAFNKKPIQTEVYDNMLAVHNKILVKELTEEEEKLNKSPYVIVGDEDSEYDTPSRRSKRKFKSSWEGYNVDDLPRVSGNLFHSVSSQLIKFAFPEYNRHIPEEDLSEIPDNILNSINNIMEPIIQSSRQEGSVLVSELRVANTKTKIAGTIDVIKIKPTGNINVLDIKSQLNFGATQKTKYKKIESYSSQIADYVSMLRSDDAILDKVPYNVEKETVLNVKINVNNGVLLGFSSPQLTPVLHQETTNKKRNELIATLSSQIEMLLSKQTAFNKGDTEYARLESLIGKKRELVISLQTEADIKNILQSMMEELAIIEANIDAGVVNYIEYKGELELYSNIGKYITPENKEDRNKRDYIAGKAKGLYRDLYEKAKDQVLGQIAPNIINPNGPVKNADDLLSLQKDIDPTRANLFGAAYNNNPIVSAAYLEAQVVLAKAREQWVEKVQEISGITEELKEFLGENIYNPFIQESNGKATGRIISQYMPEFWAEFNKAKSNKNANWFKDNVTFDLEKYNFKLKSYNEALNSSFEKDVKIKKAVLATSEKYQDKTAEELQVLAERFVRKDNKTKIENWRKTNKSEAKYFIPNDSWLDPKWKKIKQGEYKGTVVEKYYDMYTQTMDALDEFLPFDMGKNFIPDYSKSFIERVMTNGITNMNLGESYINSITIGFDEGAFGKINPFDNQPLKSIPVSGKRDFESKEEREKFIQKEKSYDLSSVLSTFLESAFRYKELQTIEQTLTVALDVLKEQNQIVETASGEAAKGTFNIFKQSKGLENTVANFEHFINSTLYGKSQEKEKGFKVKGNGITEALGLIKKGDEKLLSWARIFDRFLQYTGLNNLGYNLYSPVVNLIGGKSNALIIAMGGKYFNVPDFEFGFLSTAAGYFHVGNEAVEKANLLLREFSPDIDTYVKDMINTTSKYGINKAIDKFGPFSGMRYSEETVRNGIFIAMIKSNKNEIKWDDWKVENGKLVWIGEGNKPDIKTKELFRQKSFKVIGKAMGNMNPDDKIKLKKYWYGRAIMQHRGWLPAMWDARFSGILSGPQYDYILQEYVEGRFTTFYKTAVKKLISGEKMTDMEKQNFKEALVEHSLMIASYLLYLGLKAAGDDDDESKYWLKIADRVNGELVFFAPFEVSSKYKILISPAPSIGTMENLGKLIFDTPKELLGRTIDNEDWMKSAKPQKRLFRAIPVVGQAVRWMDDVFDTQIADTEDKK